MSNYTGDPAATQAPSPPPGQDVEPVGDLPDDGDALNAASVAQAFKVCLDFIAWLTNNGVFKAVARTITALHTFAAGINVTQSTGNSNAVNATGNGSGSGIVATGGGTSGSGGRFFGGASNGIAVEATGDGNAPGGSFVGGDNTGTGLITVGGAANGIGLRAEGTGSGLAISANKGGTFDTGDLTLTAGDFRGRRRYAGGTAAAGGDFTFVNSWGAGAAFTTVSGNDSRGKVRVTAGTGAGSEPHLKFDFNDGNWDAAPWVSVRLAYTDDAAFTTQPYVVVVSNVAYFEWSVTGLTPVNGKVYDFEWEVIG